MKFKFYENLQDRVTGFAGAVVAITLYAEGHIKYGLQGVINGEGEVPNLEWFEESRLENIGAVGFK